MFAFITMSLQCEINATIHIQVFFFFLLHINNLIFLQLYIYLFFSSIFYKNLLWMYLKVLNQFQTMRIYLMSAPVKLWISIYIFIYLLYMLYCTLVLQTWRYNLIKCYLKVCVFPLMTGTNYGKKTVESVLRILQIAVSCVLYVGDFIEYECYLD